MTAEDQALIESLLDTTPDAVVELTLITGELARVRPIILIDEPPTPDLFCVDLDPDGKPLGTSGRSILLSDIASVRISS